MYFTVAYFLSCISYMLSSVNMGRRKLRLRVCKYGERRHSESEKEEKSQLIVSIELTSKISVLRVSLPREMYLVCPVDTLPALGARLKCQRLPPQWYISDALPSSLRVFKMHEEAGVPEISCTIECHEDLYWSVNIMGKKLDPATSQELAANFAATLQSVPELMRVLAFMDSCRLCIGNSEQKFIDVVKHHEVVQQGIITHLHIKYVDYYIVYAW